MKTDIKTLFQKHKGYLRKQQIPDRATYSQVLEMVKSGKIERIKRGVYYYNSKSANPVMIDINKIVPNGVLCLWSAWSYYELTLQIPQSFNIAVEKRRKVIIPDYPPITLYCWQQEYYKLGMTQIKINGYTVNIYDLEKSVCDAIRYRTKIGINVASEILKTYLKRQDRNITKLMGYAKQMRIEKILRTYLEIQL